MSIHLKESNSESTVDATDTNKPPSHERVRLRNVRLNSLDNGREVREEVVAHMDDHDYSPKDIHAVQLALEEAVVNAFKHGNSLDPSKCVYVWYMVHEREAWIWIEDQGPGFAVEAVPDPTLPENCERPCGRGLFMMRHFMDVVQYNQAGNVCWMYKYRSGQN
jgi:serine/threonine-protein kinase RsbW